MSLVKKEMVEVTVPNQHHQIKFSRDLDVTYECQVPCTEPAKHRLEFSTSVHDVEICLTSAEMKNLGNALVELARALEDK